MEGKTNYRITRSCANCVFAFKMVEYDEEAAFFCNKSGDRPKPCGSVAMDESAWSLLPEVPLLAHHLHTCDELHAAHRVKVKVFEEWAKPRQVAANGVCDDYTPSDQWGDEHN